MTKPFNQTDHRHMARAIQLAAKGKYTTKPNPMVGCVLVKGDNVVGEGFHQKAGEAHAEVLAIQAVGEQAKGATAYVTLEPCAHQGQTGPCADALIDAGVAKVITAMRDPNPEVNGKGIEKLRGAGIDVAEGLLEAEARKLNRGFIKRMSQGLPWVRIKLAMSMDGRTALANGESQWISGNASRKDVAQLRAQSGAILTSSGTVRNDNPRLTVRGLDVPFVPPVRVMLDAGLALPTSMHLYNNDAPTLVYHDQMARHPQDMTDEQAAQTLVQVPAQGAHVDLPAVLSDLAARGINEVQIEAGHTLAGAFLAEGLVDELMLYIAPCLLGSSAMPLLGGMNITSMEQRHQMHITDVRQMGGDLRVTLTPKHTQSL